MRFYSGGYRAAELGHEFIEFDVRRRVGENYAVVRYANQSNYRDEDLIRKEVAVSMLVVEELMRIVRESQILLADDSKWPKPQRESKQELEVRFGKDKMIWKTKGRLSLANIEAEANEGENGLKSFYYLVQDVKVFVFSLMSINFKENPITK